MNQPEIKGTMMQMAPWPTALEEAVEELKYLPGWLFSLVDADRGQGCKGLTLIIIPDKPDSYHPERNANTRFPYPVPAAAFNRESWEEWLWARIEETEGHERAEWFRFVGKDGKERRPFKPLHADGFDPGVIRRVVNAGLADTPNAGRLVKFPCVSCKHYHHGKMGEHFVIEMNLGCVDINCWCGTDTNSEKDMRRISQDPRERF